MNNSKFFPIISAVFVTTLIVSNIIAVKIGNFGGYFLPVAVVIFPVSYIIGDVLTEVYGFPAARRVIWLGFFCNVLAVLAMWIGQKIPGAPFFQNQSAYEAILGTTPRLLGASFVAYLFGEFSNSVVMAKLKIKTKGRYLWLRTIGSTIVGEGLDSFIFISLAFWGVFEPAQIFTLAATQWGFKTLFEAIATPFTYVVVAYIKKHDKVDVYDENTSFSPIKF